MIPLDETQDCPHLSRMPAGVFLVVRHYGYNCAGKIVPGPRLPPEAWFNCALNRKVEWKMVLDTRPGHGIPGRR
jgi:hypothetical protein